MPQRQSGAYQDPISILDETVRTAVPRWLTDQRWFADKGRSITGIGLEDASLQRVAGDWLMLAIVQVDFADGVTARYFLPIAVTRTAVDDDTIAVVEIDGEQGALVNATRLPWFGGWLLGMFTASEKAGSERWTFEAADGVAGTITAARQLPAAVSRAEQSNTSLRYGDVLMVKLFRRLQPGPNPDEEVLRALGAVGFVHVPRFLGAGSWQSDDNVEYPIALVQAFAPNVGDGWSWMLSRLEGVASGEIAVDAASLTPERLLGRRTGELHVALSQINDPDFAPISTRVRAIETNVQRVREEVDDAAKLLRERQGDLPEPLRRHLPLIIDRLRQAVVRAEGFWDEAETRSIRVHGDFHLGQTLRTPDDDWTIIDFEGEPARPVAERRAKTSALKDAAGMLRSFGYACGVAERAAAAQGVAGGAAPFAQWEIGARQAFLEGYREALRIAPVPLAPQDDAAFMRAVSAWELDKALYEIAYEARNRPDWLALPLRGLVPGVADQPTEATGAAPA